MIRQAVGRLGESAARSRRYAPMKAWMSGNVAGTGTFRCTDCDYPVSLDAVDELPTCPNCGGTEFVRASLFTTAQRPSSTCRRTRGPGAGSRSCATASTSPGSTSPTGPATETCVAFALQREWTRIGRSLAADIRFDDPDRLAPARADRAPARRPAGARRPQPQRRVRQRRAGRVEHAGRRRRDRDRAPPPALRGRAGDLGHALQPESASAARPPPQHADLCVIRAGQATAL